MRRAIFWLGVGVWILCAGGVQAQTPGALESVLEHERVSLSSQGEPLRVVMERLREAVWLNVVVDRQVDLEAPVTVEAQDRPVGEALDAVLAGCGLERSVWCGVVYVHPAGIVPAPSTRDPLESQLPGYSVRFSGTSLRDVVALLEELSGLRIVLSPSAEGQAEAGVRLHVRNLALRHVLTLVAHQLELTWQPHADGVWVGGEYEDPDAPGATLEAALDQCVLGLEFEGTTLEDLVSYLRGASGIAIRIEGDVPRQTPLSLHLERASLRQALDAITRQAAVRWRPDGDAVVIEPRSLKG